MTHDQKSIIQDSSKPAIRSSLIISLVYATIASVWIILSDLFVEQFLHTPDDALPIQLYKGLGFVLITASSLFVLLFRYFRRFIDHENQLRVQGKKLLESENLYRRLVETSRDLIWSLSAEGQIIFINDASREIFGREPHEMIGRQYHDFVSSDHIEASTRALEIALSNNDRLRDFQNDIPHKDGRRRTLSTNAILIRDEYGQVIGSTGISRDITEHLNVVGQLEQTHILLEQTFASLTEAVFVIDTTDRTVVTCNSAVEQILGYSPDEIVGKNTEFLHVNPESYGEFAALCNKHLARDGIFSTEYRMKQKDGRIIDTDHTVALLHPGSGLEQGAVSVIRDITERKQSRLKLQASEARYRQLFENAPVMIMEHDFSKMKQYLQELGASQARVDGLEQYLQTHPEVIEDCLNLVGVLDVNQTGVEMYGADSRAHLLDGLNKILLLDDDTNQQRLTDLLLAVHEGKQVFQCEFTNQTLRRERIELLIRWIILPGHEATYERVLVTAVDITDRKQIENDLRRTLSRERQLRSQAHTLRLIAESLVLATDIQSALETAIQHLENMLQFDAIMLLSVERDQLVPIIDYGVPALANSIQERNYTKSEQLLSAMTKGHTLRSSATRHDAIIRRLLSISDIAEGWIVVPLITRGITMGLVTVSRLEQDFSEEDVRLVETFSYQIASALDNSKVHQDLQNSYHQLQIAQEKTVRSARLSAIGELAAGVAHQVNNPLMTIIADSHLMLKYIEPDSPLLASAEAISRAAHKAGTTVQRLLDFSKTTAGNMAELDVNNSLQQVLNLIRPQIEPRYAEIQTDFSNTLPRLYGSEDHLQDVWMNLLLNARDAVTGTENARIIVKTEFDVQNNKIQVTIQDNGMGMHRNQIDRIFDPFFTTKERGTGLGLAICADIISQHRGEIDVESQAGEGTRFIIALPLEV